MGTVKARTLSEKMGFSDPDLRTPEHDAIICWFEENALALLGPWLPNHEKWSSREVSYITEAFSRHNKTAPQLPEIPLPGSEYGPTIQLCRWEPVIVNARQFEVGFMDLLVVVSYPSLFCSTSNDNRASAPEAITVRSEDFSFWIEAKPSVTSLGELFRQLGLYRKCIHECPQVGSGYIRQHKIIVVSPDDRQASRIQSQGYGFIKSPCPTTTATKSQQRLEF